ncbi:hypothetical protein BDW69DRAFT_183595 [Aspergillus filifer]
MRDIDDSLAQLARITVAIRKAGTRSRLQKADAAFDPSSASLRAFRRYLEILLVLERGVDETSNSLIQQINQRSLSPIQTRLVEANLRRRHRFLYAQRHAEKLGEGSSAQVGDPEDVAPSIIAQSQVPTHNLPRAGSTERPQAHSATTATRLDVSVMLSPNQERQAATTVLSETTFGVTYPLPPAISEGQEIFTCPCCYLALPAIVAKGQKWNKIGKLTWTVSMLGYPFGVAVYAAGKESTLHVYTSPGVVLGLYAHAPGDRVSYLRLQRGYNNTDQDTVFNHVADHIHAFALTSLPWPPDDLVYGDDMERPDADLTRSRNYPYFATNSSKPAVSTITFDGLSDTSDVESPNVQKGPEEFRVTEELLKDVGGQSRDTITGDWLEMLAMNFGGLSVALQPDDQELVMNTEYIGEGHPSRTEARDAVEASLKGKKVDPNSDDQRPVATVHTGENDATLTSQPATKRAQTKKARNEYQTDFHHEETPQEDEDTYSEQYCQERTSNSPSHRVPSYPPYGTDVFNEVYWNAESVSRGNLQEHVSEFPQPTPDPYSFYRGNRDHELADNTTAISTEIYLDAHDHPGNHATMLEDAVTGYPLTDPTTAAGGATYSTHYPRDSYGELQELPVTQLQWSLPNQGFTPETIHYQLGPPTALDSEDTIEGHYKIQEPSYFKPGKVFAILWKFESQQVRAQSDLGVQDVTLLGANGVFIPGVIGYMVVAKVVHNATWCL